MRDSVIYLLSDSIGETAEAVIRAAASQFEAKSVEIRRISYVSERKTIKDAIETAKNEKALVVFTLVVPEMQHYLISEAVRHQVPYVDLMGPVMNGIHRLLGQEPKREPGIIHKLDKEYFRKVAAIEFAVKYDDGKDPRGVLQADVVLVGVSRTSKTPLSMYLAHRGFKVANIPLVPEVEPPEELFTIPKERCIGLIIEPNNLNHIRKERLKALGLPADANYANHERIELELIHAKQVIRRIGCPEINVSNKAVEETANIVLAIIEKQE